MKKYSIASICLAVVSGAVILWAAITAPARAVERDLAAVNTLSAGQTTEAELLTRKEFQTLDRICTQETCLYHMGVENTLLSKLHLAPAMDMGTIVRVRDGLVTNVSVFVVREGLPAISVAQVQALPKECSAIPCVRPLVLPNKTLLSISILFNNQSDIRNRMPQVINARCWSRLHGCATYAEFVPLTQGMNLEQQISARK